MKRLGIILSVFVAFTIALIISFPYLLERALKAGSGPVRRFELTTKPAFLVEEMALEKARETLRLDGLDVDRWQPYPLKQTKAPDGQVDQFINRNSMDPNRGVFMFTNASSTTVRFVSVELHESTVTCQSSIGR